VIITNHKLNIKGKMNSRCHRNSYLAAKKENLDLWIGFVVENHSLKPDKGGMVYYIHAFNVKDNIVIDCTLGADKELEYTYVGKRVDVEHFKSGDDLFDKILWKMYNSISCDMGTLGDLEKSLDII